MSIDCTFPRPSIQQLQGDLKTEISTRILGGAPVLPMSNEDILAFIMAGTVNLMHGYVNQAIKEADPKDMCCDNLVAYAARKGIYLSNATRARGAVVITGDPGAVIPGDIRFIGEAAREYKLDPTTITNPIVLDSAGRAALRVAAAVGGPSYNAGAGAVLTLASTLPGIDGTATVTDGGIKGGAAAETCEVLRSRVLALEGAGAVSTNLDWYQGQALRWPGVTRVCVDQCEGCCDTGRIDMYAFFDGAYLPDGVPPPDVLDEMTEWMFGQNPGRGEGRAPVGAVGSFKTPLPTYLDIVVRCWRGCEPGMDVTIKEALAAYAIQEYCVGSSICRKNLESVISQTMGSTGCYASVDFTFDESIAREDSAFSYLDCQHYLSIRDVTFGAA